MLVTPPDFQPLLVPREADRHYAFVFRGAELLLLDGDPTPPGLECCAALGLDADALLPVGVLGGHYCAAGWVPRDAPAPPGHHYSGLRPLFSTMPESLLAVAGRAFQIAEWARTHRHCGACGTPTVHVHGERCLRCPACGHAAYPRISPAMMTLVKRGDSILLARHTASPMPRYTALAGFLEAGESIEDAIHREVYEEVGLTVKDLRYFGSQSWPFPHSLMVAFTAEYAGGDIRIDGNEIADARWFGSADEMPPIPPGVSIATELIRANLPAGWRG